MEYDTDNDWLVVGSQDRNVYVFNSLTGELLMQYPVNGKVDDLDYDQASKQILVSSGVSATKHTLAVLNLETGEELFSLSLRNTASAAQFSPDLQYIYYGDSPRPHHEDRLGRRNHRAGACGWRSAGFERGPGNG